jgi:flagellar basal body-associated protein FliL
MKSKLKFILPVVVLLVAGVAYKKVLAKKPPAVKPKIVGGLVALDPEFVVNLAGGRYGKLSVTLLMPHPPVAGKDATAPPLPKENDVVRAIITDDLTGADPQALIAPRRRAVLLARILKDLNGQTDEKVAKVYFTDLAIQ